MPVQRSVAGNMEAVYESIYHFICSKSTSRNFWIFVLEQFSRGFSTEKNNQVTSFFSAASSGISLNNAFTLGRSASTVLVHSSTDLEYLAKTVTVKRSNHLSHSIAGDFVWFDQNQDNPGNNDG